MLISSPYKTKGIVHISFVHLSEKKIIIKNKKIIINTLEAKKEDFKIANFNTLEPSVLFGNTLPKVTLG